MQKRLEIAEILHSLGQRVADQHNVLAFFQFQSRRLGGVRPTHLRRNGQTQNQKNQAENTAIHREISSVSNEMQAERVRKPNQGEPFECNRRLAPLQKGWPAGRNSAQISVTRSGGMAQTQ
jgi:hypothetical protein